jgi:hypothetical protein
MSAPDTNVQKQKRRHRPALIGIAIAVALGAVFFLLNMFTAVDEDAELAEDGPLMIEEGATTDAPVTD